jgi:hypothetical protein
MFRIELFGAGADGAPAGPAIETFDGDNIDDAIAEAELFIRDGAYPFGKARSFKIYDSTRALIYDSEAD